MGLKRSRSDTVSAPIVSSAPTVSATVSADAKMIHLDPATPPAQRPVMKCSLPPHQPLTFTSFEDYDIHYQKTHVHRCVGCGKNFPDEHFLHLHIAENHDPIRAALKEQGEKTYACLIPTCDRLCSTPHKRRLHCIDKHAFPRNYDFFIVNDGIDRRSSLLRPPRRENGPPGTRTRSDTVGSTTSAHQGEKVHGKGTGYDGAQVQGAEKMEVVRDDDAKEEGGEKGVKDEDMDDSYDTFGTQRTPVKLRGRGGFGHPQGHSRGQGRGRGWSRGRGRGRGGLQGDTANNVPLESTHTPASKEDPMDGLASSLSALQFVPHSVRMAKGRGRG